MTMISLLFNQPQKPADASTQTPTVATVQVPPRGPRKKRSLSCLQRFCLSIVPCLGIFAAGLVIYIAVNCDVYFGMAQEKGGALICEPKSTTGEGGEEVVALVANVVKVTVILIVLVTVTFTLTVAAWHVMSTRCSGKSEVTIEAEPRPITVTTAESDIPPAYQVLIMPESILSWGGA